VGFRDVLGNFNLALPAAGFKPSECAELNCRVNILEAVDGVVFDVVPARADA
jgi:hypothetical protein